MPAPSSYRALRVALVCLALGVGSGAWLLLSARLVGGPAAARIQPVHALTTGVLDWACWGLLFAPARALAARFPLWGAGAWRSAAVHVPAAFAFALAQTAAFSLASLAARALLYGEPSVGGEAAAAALAVALRVKLPGGVLVALLFAAAASGLDARRRAREAELEGARLGRELAEARLASLQARLHPHFLFNALNAVQSLVRSDPDGAETMVARLADLLRGALSRAEAAEETLDDELDLLERYLDVERVRFGGRLEVRLRVDPAARGALVPTLLLQPLAENAVRHGVARRPGRARLDLAVERRGERVEIEIENDAPADAGGDGGGGLGLTSTRERLRALHGDRASLELVRSPDAAGGSRVTVRVSLPWRIGANGGGTR